eukprot:1194271-Pleurochrysis_carterae.AAC.1
MVRELEQVERELHERDRAEIAQLREQVIALAASQARSLPSAPSEQQPQTAGSCVPPADRAPSR